MTEQIRMTPVDAIASHPDNPKAHDVDTIVASLTRFGFAEPIVIDQRTGLNVSGHGRVKALTVLRDRGDAPPDGIDVDDDGTWLAPVFVGWSSRNDDEAAAALIALNRTTETGGWVTDSLTGLLGRLAEIDDGLAGVGFDDRDLADLRARLAGPPDLDDLANGYDPDGDPFAHYVKVVAKVPPEVATRWSKYASRFDDDAGALVAALDEVGA